MAAPKTGRLFFKSHGDCFIHATASFVKYWNFSLALVSIFTQLTLILTWAVYYCTTGGSGYSEGDTGQPSVHLLCVS